MQSYELVAAETIELREVPTPEPEPGEVRVKVQACSICSRTDLVYYLYCGIKPHCHPGHFGHRNAEFKRLHSQRLVLGQWIGQREAFEIHPESVTSRLCHVRVLPWKYGNSGRRAPPWQADNE